MDIVDKEILRELRKNSRIPMTTLAKRVGRSRTAVLARINRMELEGIIDGYTIYNASSKSRPMDIGAIISVYVAVRSGSDSLVELFKDITEIDHCLGVAGDATFILLVSRCSSDRLQEIIEIIYQSPGVTNTETVISLTTNF